MTIEVSFWHVFSAVALLLAGAWALVKVLGSQFEKRIDDKFAGLKHAREADRAEWEQRYTRQEEALRRVAELENALATRTTAIEKTLEFLPTREEISRVREEMAAVRSENAAQTESLKRVEAQMRLITEWMINNK